MTPALLRSPSREYRLFIAPERARGAGVYKDKGTAGEGRLRGVQQVGVRAERQRREVH